MAASGSTELLPASPSRSTIKYNRGRAGTSKVPLKELEDAPLAGVASEIWAEKQGFVARVRTPALDSTSSSSWNTACLPEVQFFTDGDIYSAHTSAFEDITLSWDATQYMVDDPTLIGILCRKMREDKVKGRMILDKSNYSKSNGWGNECPMVEELRVAGCELRQYRPQGGGFASLHAKSWLLDNAVVLTGSVNLTSGGMSRNKEHMLRITTPSVVRSFAEDFEDLWAKAEPITAECCETQIVAWRKLPEKQATRRRDNKDEKQRARSASLVRENVLKLDLPNE